MKILIAESKSMAAERPVAEAGAFTEPQMMDVAREAMKQLSGLDVAELAQRLRLSPSLARRMYQCVYNFADTRTGIKAAEGFTGVVFRKLDYSALPPQAADFAENRLRIISSLYGLLRPSDIIKDYRMEFSSAVFAGLAMKKHLRPLITRLLLDEADLTSGGLLLLLPADAAACLDIKELRKRMPVTDVRFVSVADNAAVRSPHSTRLKELRGLLAREILIRGIDSPDALAGLSTADFAWCEELSTPTTITFLAL